MLGVQGKPGAAGSHTWILWLRDRLRTSNYILGKIPVEIHNLAHGENRTCMGGNHAIQGRRNNLLKEDGGSTLGGTPGNTMVLYERLITRYQTTPKLNGDRA
jgi:hypothetical protein